MMDYMHFRNAKELCEYVNGANVRVVAVTASNAADAKQRFTVFVEKQGRGDCHEC